jgi:hypothetical protein
VGGVGKSRSGHSRGGEGVEGKIVRVGIGDVGVEYLQVKMGGYLVGEDIGWWDRLGVDLLAVEEHRIGGCRKVEDLRTGELHINTVGLSPPLKKEGEN